MAVIGSKTLFVTTSPRSPEKMIPEIELLVRNFSGRRWDSSTQALYMSELSETGYFNGSGKKDPALSARDRINRGPKSLGFVTLNPVIALTAAGEALLSHDNFQEVLLRQLLKFQLPSPFHIPSKTAARFWVKPYLEILRLIRELGSLKFDELHIFGMQLTDWHGFERVKRKILRFRADKQSLKGNYLEFRRKVLLDELSEIYAAEIEAGGLKTRERKRATLQDALLTKGRNMRDYADACSRYLRATGLINVSYVGKSLSILQERQEEVDFILNTIDRNPYIFNNDEEYLKYLGGKTSPLLLTDDAEYLRRSLMTKFPDQVVDDNADVSDLKRQLSSLTEQRKWNTIDKQVEEIKRYKYYEDIQQVYDKIASSQIYDPALMMEWNTWRAMTMLDGGAIKANLKFDDYGMPMSNAQGNMADIVCDYGDYQLSVEVTLQSGQRQYEAEGEPVSRHLGNLKKSSQKDSFCLFIAPTINEACIAHFYALHKLNISYYGGKSIIVPLPLSIFRKILEDSYSADCVISPDNVKRLFERSMELALDSDNERDWYNKLIKEASDWIAFITKSA